MNNLEKVQISTKHKVVCVPSTSPSVEAVKNLWPHAKEVSLGGLDHILVPHQPAESFMLRRIGYDVPAPILHNYVWPHPHGEPPFHAQRMTAAMMTSENRCYVLNGMGTGKTRAALWAYDYLRGNNLAKKMLVVAPLSTLNVTWGKEVFRVTPHLKVVVLHGAKAKRLKLLEEDADIYLINHDGLKVIFDEVMARVGTNGDIDTLTIDELAVYRNGGAQRTKDMRKLAARMNWVWGMTGSPIPTSPTDAHAQATIINPSRVPKFFGRFREELMTRVTQFKWAPKKDAVERAYDALQPAVRFTLDDVYELPQTVTRWLDVDMGPNQARVYKDMKDTCVAAIKNQEITAANAGAALSKLLQVSTGWVYTADKNIVALDNDNRLEALIDAIQASDRKVLVFSPFKHNLAGISSRLTKESIDHATVSGDTSSNERSRLFNLFQNTDKFKVLNAHPQCLAHGLTLTAADTIIWYAPVTSLEIYDQANARISRVGQKHKQLVLHLQSTPVERKIYKMLYQKQEIQSKLLELFEGATANL